MAMFSKITLTTYLLLTCICIKANAQFLEPPKELAADIQAAEAEGALMYKLDQAVWVSSDAAQRVKGFKGDSRVRGWLTEQTEQGIQVTFYGGKKKTVFLALYRALVSPDGLTEARPAALGAGEPLTEFELAQATARETAMTIHMQRCARHYNTIALVRSTLPDRSWSFYLMPSTTEPKVIVAGIDYRVDVDWQGKNILNQRAFSKSCIQIPDQQGPDGSESVGAYLTHLLDPIPTPIHVFLSLQHREMLAIGTVENSLAWMVKDGHILQLDMKAAANAKPDEQR
jgi:hypothetical protein